MAFSEEPLVLAIRMAVADVNAEGGVLGRKIEIVEADGKSNDLEFGIQAERLILDQDVVAIFGCWQSTARIAVKSVVEKHGSLLYYPLQYEGETPSENIFYFGAAPNQQIFPAIEWVTHQFKTTGSPLRVFLLGSDYIFPKKAHALVKQCLDPATAIVVGDVLVPIDEMNFDSVLKQIDAARPNVIINTLNGRSNFGFFSELVRQGRNGAYPIMSFCIGEPEIRKAGTEGTAETFATWNYFATTSGSSAEAFRNKWQEFLRRTSNAPDSTIPASDPVEASYLSVRMWAEAARRAGSVETKAILKSSRELIWDAPEGIVRLDSGTRHLWKPVRIGRVNQHGDLVTIAESVLSIKPMPESVSGLAPNISDLAWRPTAPPSIAVAGSLVDSANPSDRMLGMQTVFAPRPVPRSAVEQAARLLRDPDWRVQFEAIRLVMLGGERDSPGLAELLRNGSPDTRILLLTALAQVWKETGASARDAGLVNLSLDQLAHVDPAVRLASLRALSFLPVEYEVDGSQLVQALQSEEYSVRLLAIQILRRCAAISPETIDALAGSLPQQGHAFRSLIATEVAQTLIVNCNRLDSSLSPELLSAFRSAQSLIATEPDARPAVATLETALNARTPQIKLATQIRMWAAESWTHSLITICVLALFTWTVLLAFLFWLSPVSILTFHRGFGHISNRVSQLSMGHIGVPLDFLLGTHWLATHNRVLDAWIGKHLPAAQEALKAQLQRVGVGWYFSLPALREGILYRHPISDGGDATEGTGTPKGLIRSIFQSSHAVLFITGEGGSGKTTLAMKIATMAINGELFNGRCAVPLLLQRNDTAGSEPLKDGKGLEAIIFQTLKSVTGCDSLNSKSFVNALLRKQRVLLVIDDLSWMMPATSTALSEIGLNLHAVVITSRSRRAIGVLREVVVELPRLEGEVLNQFLGACVDEADSRSRARGVAPLRNRDQIVQDACDRLGSTSKSLPALFVDLYARTLIGEQHVGSQFGSAAFGLAGIVERYLAAVWEATPNPAKIPIAQGLSVAERLAWLCIKTDLAPSAISVQTALADLKIPQTKDLLTRLAEQMFLLEFDQPRREHIRFVLDPIVEYLACLAIRNGRVDHGELSELVRRIREGQLLRAESKAFLSALRETLRGIDALNADVEAVRQALQSELHSPGSSSKRPIVTVAILHSLQGTMSFSEQSLVPAAQLAIREVNESQFLPEVELRAIVRDGQSQDEVFAEAAREVIDEHAVVSIFGCWTSSSRQRVLPIIERKQNLLWYPVQYEGYESSTRVIYTGSTPNQQIIPAIRAMRDILGVPLKIMCIGSNYLFPWTANAILRRLLELENKSAMETGAAPFGEIVGKPIYYEFGATELGDIDAQINSKKPNLIFNTINGDTNIEFFNRLFAAGIRADSTPVLSVSIAEQEVARIGAKLVAGHYASWSYFHSLDDPANLRFQKLVGARLGRGWMLDDPIAMSYTQIWLFAHACRIVLDNGGRLLPTEIAAAALGLDFDAPGGRVQVDTQSRHLWKRFHLGKAREDGQFDVIASSREMLPPNPWPYPNLVRDP